jgi:hypothetical protein
MSLVRVQSEEPNLEKPAQRNLSGLFAFYLAVLFSQEWTSEKKEPPDKMQKARSDFSERASLNLAPLTGLEPEEPNLEKPAQRNLSGLFAFYLAVLFSQTSTLLQKPAQISLSGLL